MADRIPIREAIARQTQSLADGAASLAAALEALPLGELASGTTIVTGIGASLYAAQTGAAYMRACGMRAFALASTELYDAAFDGADAYIALSASGRSVEPAKAMELRPNALSFGISGVVDSPLSAYVRHMIGTACGADSGPNTTSYNGTLLALAMMAEQAAARFRFDWRHLPELAGRVLDAVPRQVARAAERFRNRTSLDCVASSENLGTAGYTALLLREAPRVAAQQWDTLNFLHGPMEPNDAGTGVILFGDGREVELASVLAGFGIPSLLITSRSDVAEADNLVTITIPATGNSVADAILHTLPAQLLTTQMAEDAGLPVCEFRYRQTGTKLDSPI
ncbi:SIS domain-containing protein [Jiella sp. M17.18]|uniref:SIS domain-containing protein n=1 Tax=Jiella sp. M17.18 TaxID=3234247 RepID=UPI0034DF5800